MKRYVLLVVIPLLAVLSCASFPEQEPELFESAPVPVAEAQQEAPVEFVPEPTPEPVPEPAPEPVSEPAPKPVFDPVKITREQYNTAKGDVQRLVQELNGIIQSRNYESWATYLSASYLDQIKSSAFLAKMTEQLYERDKAVASRMGKSVAAIQKRILRTSQDYFIYVVVPARSNSRVDDISFISNTWVTAYTVSSNGQREILYDLEQIDGKWKITGKPE
jgi:outer membrane biosynthesis protein TonB